MGQQSRVRWVFQWAEYGVWWLGVWVASLSMLLFPAALLSRLPGISLGSVMAVLTGLLSLFIVYAAWRQAPNHLLRSVDREFGGRLRTCRQDPSGRVDDDPSGMNAFIGMFAGLVLTVLLSAVLRTVSERLGYGPPADGPTACCIFLGAWLGAFTWIHLGAGLNSRLTASWLCVSGSGALAMIAWAVVFYSQVGNGEWSREKLWVALFTLAVPLAWSIQHLLIGVWAQFQEVDGPEDGESPGAGWPDGPSGPFGGAGRPSPRPTGSPQRWGRQSEQSPGFSVAPLN